MFTLPKLPYTQDALEPDISAESMKTHHGKHHKKYVDTLNALIKDTEHENAALDEIIIATRNSDDGAEKKIFNNAAQHWNHSFLWNSFTPDYDRSPDNMLLAAIDKDFGSFAKFKKGFVEQGVGHFGSGWVWLIATDGGLEIMTTHDADLPLAHEKHALLTCDLWEHAYYLDYKSDREGFLETFIDRLADWDFAASNFEAANASHSLESAE